MAERHVAQGNALIIRQCQMVDRLDARGFDSSIAMDLLAVFHASQQIFEDDWRRYTRELGKLDDLKGQNEKFDADRVDTSRSLCRS